MSTPNIPLTASAVEERLRAELVDLGVDAEEITSDSKFDMLGIDSLDVADLMTMVTKEFRVDIPRSELADVTIGELVERIVASVSA
jgi:acyl carrier protein